MRAIGYARVSTTKQDLARQRCKITNFCGENGYELEFIIEDFGISGATLDRKGYQRLNSLTDNDCDVIVVSEIS
ncbi:MAG: recombinase family protein, partial [Lachnospiraceae bacterium]|nr:recombinase family protein [Lachnospiraceae bacterium]